MEVTVEGRDITRDYMDDILREARAKDLRVITKEEFFRLMEKEN